MLDEFCNSLSDEAQLKIAIRLGELTLPVWDKYFTESPEEMEKLNELYQASGHVSGSLDKISRSYLIAKNKIVEQVTTKELNRNSEEFQETLTLSWTVAVISLIGDLRDMGISKKNCQPALESNTRFSFSF